MARRIWNGSNGSWSTPSNWSPNGVPQRGDLVFIMGGKVDANGVNLKGESITIDAVSANAMTSLSIENSDFGPGNYTSLINGAYLILNNSNVYGTLVATQGGGQITVPAESVASNHGWWGIASPTGSDIVLVADGTFVNYGAIEAGQNGAFTLSTLHDVSNYGNIQIDPGGRMYVFSGNQTPDTYTTLTNAGNITVNGGLIDMGADVLQAVHGKTTITNNGTLQLDGHFDGNTIDIHKGMLTFQQTPAFESPGPLAAAEMTAHIAFTGKTGEIDLGQAVIAAYRPATNDILVTAPWKGGQAQVADFKLTGHYSPHDFTFGNNGQIYYHDH